MKRNLIAVAAAVLALGTTAALADNNWAFDDGYWKQAQSVQSVQAAQAVQSGEIRGKYDLVDNYNP
jgi:hypothetical protein